MRTLDLVECKVSELSSDEMQNTFGGGWWSDFKQGFVDGFTWFYDQIVGVLSAL